MTTTLETFFGTGGVGKTTLSTSRAYYLATQGYKVALITIDPAKRLKDLLHLDPQLQGELEQVNVNGCQFQAMLLNPYSSLARMVKNQELEKLVGNRLLKILFSKHGGLDEIMGFVEVDKLLSSGDFDYVILDTPPGKHFLDFLQSCHKIEKFFDSSFIETFKYMRGGKEKKSFLKSLISSGVQQMMKYLDKVTGKKFVEEFMDALILIYELKDTFFQSLKVQEQLRDAQRCQWYLVGSLEQDKFSDAKSLKADASKFLHSEGWFVLNRCLPRDLAIPASDKVKKLYQHFQSKQERSLSESKKHHQRIATFDESMGTTPLEQVMELSRTWSQYEKE